MLRFQVGFFQNSFNKNMHGSATANTHTHLLLNTLIRFLRWCNVYMITTPTITRVRTVSNPDTDTLNAEQLNEYELTLVLSLPSGAEII